MSDILKPQVGPLPHAAPSPLTQVFWDAAAQHRLIFQRCESCGAITFPPVEVCRICLSTQLQWKQSSGRGVLYSWTVVHRPVTPDFATPYVPAIVDVDEGYQMVSNLIGISTDRIRAGLPVQVSFEQIDGNLVLPYFRPAES